MNADGWTQTDPAPPRRSRDGYGVVLAFLATNLIYGGAGIPLVVQELIPRLWPQPEIVVLEAVYYDPDGMEEGEGFEDAPEDAVPGNPDAKTDADPNPMPTEAPAAGEDVPPAEVTTDAPVPEQPEQEVVDLLTPENPDDAELVDPTDTPQTDPNPSSPVRGKPGGTTAPGADPNAADVEDKPGIDPTKMKDMGDKAGATNKETGCADPHPQITKVGDKHWQIEKDLVDYYTSSIAVFNTLGYSRKYDENDVKGWLIGGFGCKGPLYKAGFRSKDVIQLVNGHKTNNVAQILGVWLTSKKYGDFEIVFWRKGQVITHTYTVPKDEKPGKKPKPDGTRP